MPAAVSTTGTSTRVQPVQQCNLCEWRNLLVGASIPASYRLQRTYFPAGNFLTGECVCLCVCLCVLCGRLCSSTRVLVLEHSAQLYSTRARRKTHIITKPNGTASRHGSSGYTTREHRPTGSLSWVTLTIQGAQSRGFEDPFFFFLNAGDSPPEFQRRYAGSAR